MNEISLFQSSLTLLYKMCFVPYICDYLSNYVTASHHRMLIFSKLVNWIELDNVGRNSPLLMNEHKNKRCIRCILFAVILNSKTNNSLKGLEATPREWHLICWLWIHMISSKYLQNDALHSNRSPDIS